MVIYSRSYLQNFDNWWFWIRKNKCIVIKEQDDIVKNLFVRKRFK